LKKVITYGTYDLFHEGHYNLLKRAKALGDYLIVGVTTEHFDEARGKVNVIDPIMDRIEHVRKTGFADEIIIEDHVGQKIEDIQKYNIDIFTVGSDWEGVFDYLKVFCQVVYLPRTPDVSSTMIRKTQFRIVRTGIVGTGRIAPRFLSEAKYVSGISIVRAYNPERQSGMQFQEKYGIECMSDSYEDFLNVVDAVYIAAPNQMHYEYARKALENGKHVLCEKPLSFTKKESEELYQVAKENHLVLLEGVRTAYCPGFQQLMNVAQSGIIGEICDVEACLTRLADVNSRERTDAAYGGSFLEYGNYALLPIIKLLGKDYKNVRFQSLRGKGGIDLYTKMELEYANGMATAKTGVAVKTEGHLVISGTGGYILAPSPWWLTKRFEVHYEDPNKVEVYEPNFQGDGFRYEINEFVSKIGGYGKNGYKLTAEEAIVMAEITEEFMKTRQGAID
jgi:glycerol-3-phosphate cytidylyltransferase